MTKYEPKTDHEVRQHIRKLVDEMHPRPGKSNWTLALNDLDHAEACLQEREAEIAELRKLLREDMLHQLALRRHEELTCPTS